MKELLGGKGAGLAEMTRIGLPVPAGFHHHDGMLRLLLEARREISGVAPRRGEEKSGSPRARHEEEARRREDPLLVSVRSGSARSMPGMMETILNLGLNSKSVEALARNTKNDRFAWDAYRRFVQMYSSVVDRAT